jgi:murein DD-endopeptidase MepM/ murein hydrolase activator NlpD
VQGAHGVRGAIGIYHAPRSGSRIHEGFDITADCGAKLVAVRNGRVLSRGFDPVLYGNYLLIHGEGERRSYFYAHLVRPAAVRRGERVWEGSGSAPSAKPGTRSAPAATSTSRSTSAASR